MDGPDETAQEETELGQLLLQIGRGDHAAYELLYDLVAPRVLGLATRVLRSPDQSREVTQEVLLEIWCVAGSFDPNRGSAWGWTMMLAHRRAVDRVRSVHAATRRDTDWHRSAQASDLDETWEAVEEGLRVARVRRALQQLPPPQRRAIEMAYFDGHTHTQIASLRGLPLGTAKGRIHSGLTRLRRELTPSGETHEP